MRTHAVEQVRGDGREARTPTEAVTTRTPTRLRRAAVTALVAASVITMLCAASLLLPAKGRREAPRSVSSDGGGAYADGYFMSVSWQSRRLDIRTRRPAGDKGATRLDPDAFLQAARGVELIAREYEARGLPVTTLLDMDGVVRLSPAGLPDDSREEISNRLRTVRGVSRVELRELNQAELSKLWDGAAGAPDAAH